MKRKIPFGLLGLLAVGSASGQGLYYVGTETQESLPLKWVVGLSAVYDDNVSPGFGDQDSSFGLNPYVGLSFVNISPQTTWDVYARLGLIYYFDTPGGMDDVNSQSRVGVNLTHRFSERLRFSSRNFVSYELEPDYAYGYASSRQTGEYFFWNSDNSVGFRWTERLATYTGVRLTGTTYEDSDNNDRFTWEAYNQFRYQLTPQTVLTLDYRYGQTSYEGGFGSDTTNQYLLGGVEHRFSPNTIGILRVGAQFRDIDDDDDSYTSPYLEFALNSQVNSQLRIRSFARYGIEDYNTIQSFNGVVVNFEDSKTLRFGISGDYSISPTLSVFGGIDYIPTNYDGGQVVSSPNTGASFGDQDEDILNAYIGVSMKFTEYLTGTASYNYTNSNSDIDGLDYDRNRFSLGVSAEF
jgi:hypothetical protein